MKLFTLIALQTIAHLLADYTFQSKKTAKSKAKKGFRSNYLKGHILIVFIAHAVVALDYHFLPWALGIALVHGLIDGCKPYLLNTRKIKNGAFFIDQLLHITTYTLAAYIFLNNVHWQDFRITDQFGYIILIAIFLFCTKPANIVIREIFKLFSVSFTSKSKDLPNAGRLIGITERWLVVVFILVGQFSAVGFLITAKSILRFKDGDYLKTEYVLIGTMLSFAIAIGTALFYNLVVKPIL